MQTISLDKVSFRYRGQEAPALDSVALDVRKGELLAVLGGDGAGKSTFCKLLNGLIPHHVKGELLGEVLMDGRSTREMQISQLTSMVGLASQDPEVQLFTDSVDEEVAFAPENLGLQWDEIDERVRRALRLTGLSQLGEKSPSALSGGQKQRLAIAAVISLMPEVLVLDEPLSMLDPRGRSELLDVLDSLRREHGTTVVLTSHSAEEVAEHCDRIALLSRGRLIGVGAPSEVLTSSEKLLDAGIEPPQLLELSERLVAEGALQDGQTFIDEESGAKRMLVSLPTRSARR
jgi:energy-coupling factor transporter ATP-binding protein EcfA2